MLKSIIACALLGVTASAANASYTPDALLDLRQPQVVASALQQAGYKAEIKTNKNNEPYISSSANGTEFTVEFYGCKELVDCGSYQFASWYKPEAIFTVALANEWNISKRFLKIAVDKDGNLNEYLDMTATGKTTYANFADIVDWYATMDAALTKFLDGKRPAQK